MKPHPDFVAVNLPRAFNLPSFRLTPLSPEFTQEDFDVVTESSEVLKGLAGNWPEGLTLEENRIDLAWHEREFTTRRSFSWIVRDFDGLYLGCAYLYPRIGMRGAADVATWIRDRSDRIVLGAQLVAEFSEWLEVHLPSDLTLSWASR